MVFSRTLREPAKHPSAVACVARIGAAAGLCLGLGLILLGGCTASEREPYEGRAKTKAGADGEATEARPKRKATVPADGWNEDIAWRGLEEGLREAKDAGMPVMMVVHTSWCSRCKALKRAFNDDPRVIKLSEQFVMVHVDQDETPEAQLYGPDGSYIPRVMFLDSNGVLDQELENPRRSRYRYFYTPQEDLAATMREALDRHGNKS